MIQFKYIHQREDGAWPLDPYFDYIEGVADQMPEELRAFATSIDSYHIHGEASLHDSRVLSLTISKERDGVGVSNVTSVDVLFLDQMFEDKFALRYTGVTSYLATEPKLLGRNGSDVLLHEFLVLREGHFRHTVLFDCDGGYVVEFTGFSRTDVAD